MLLLLLFPNAINKCTCCCCCYLSKHSGNIVHSQKMKIRDHVHLLYRKLAGNLDCLVAC